MVNISPAGSYEMWTLSKKNLEVSGLCEKKE